MQFDLIRYRAPNDGRPPIVAQRIDHSAMFGAQLVVYPGQALVVVKGGKPIYALDQPGRYTNWSGEIFSPWFKKYFGGQNPWETTVWYIDTTIDRVPWRCDNAFNLAIDPQRKIPIALSLSGSFTFSITNAMRFLTYMVGSVDTYSKVKLVNYVAPEIETSVPTLVLQAIKNGRNIDELNVDNEIAVAAAYIANERLNHFGVSVSNIGVNINHTEDSFKTIRSYDLSKARIELQRQRANEFDLATMVALEHIDG